MWTRRGKEEEENKVVRENEEEVAAEEGSNTRSCMLRSWQDQTWMRLWQSSCVLEVLCPHNESSDIQENLFEPERSLDLHLSAGQIMLLSDISFLIKTILSSFMMAYLVNKPLCQAFQNVSGLLVLSFSGHVSV